MAPRFWLGTTSNLWGTAANWSTTSGGAGGAAVPTNADDVTFDSAGNNPCTTSTTDRVCLTLTVASGYTSTLTIATTAFLSVSGSITFNPGFTLVSGGATNAGLRMIAAGTWTTNGFTVAGPVYIGPTTSFTCTLADALTISGELQLSNSTSTTFSGSFPITADSCVISGSQTITLSDDVTINGLTLLTGNPEVLNGFNWNTLSWTSNAVVGLTGTTVIVFTGTGTWQAIDPSATMTNSVIRNGTGTLTIVNVYYSTGTITWTAGAVNHTGVLSLFGSATLDTAGMSWNNVTLTAAMTLTLNSLLSVTGTLTLPNANTTLAGTDGFTVGTFTTASTAARTHTFHAGATYTVTFALTFCLAASQAPSSGHLLWVSSSPGTPVLFVLDVLASQDVGFVDPTDIDASGGIPIFTFHGVITTSPNWINQYPGGGGAGVRVFAYVG